MFPTAPMHKEQCRSPGTWAWKKTKHSVATPLWSCRGLPTFTRRGGASSIQLHLLCLKYLLASLTVLTLLPLLSLNSQNLLDHLSFDSSWPHTGPLDVSIITSNRDCKGGLQPLSKHRVAGKEDWESGHRHTITTLSLAGSTFYNVCIICTAVLGDAYP